MNRSFTVLFRIWEIIFMKSLISMWLGFLSFVQQVIKGSGLVAIFFFSIIFVFVVVIFGFFPKKLLGEKSKNDHDEDEDDTEEKDSDQTTTLDDLLNKTEKT